MTLGRRLSDLFARRRAADGDPVQELEAAYAAQAALLQQSRRGVADVVTARKRVELQVRGLRHTADRLRSEAQEALDAGQEDAARALLERRAATLQQADALQPDLDRLREQESRLHAQVQRLEAKVEAFRTQKETLRASYSAAEAHARISEAYAGISEESADVGLALHRARERTERMQARAEAMDLLTAADAPALPGETAGESAQRRLAALSRDDVDVELDRMRAGRLDASAQGRPGPAAGEQAR